MPLQCLKFPWQWKPCLALVAASACVFVNLLPAQESAFPQLEQRYRADLSPAIKQYCLPCHSAEKREGELDLEQFRSLAEIRKQVKVWQKVGEMLDLGEMPPKESPPLSDRDRKQLRDWITGFLHAESIANAGDPGPVVLRRLSNSEYTYTIRDLTGVASMNPAREFPADGAAGEGFTNTGNALVMSPALLTKYFDAAKEIANHAVLVSDGFRFSPHSTPSDWTNELLARIRDLYQQHTAEVGGTQVNLQGIVFDTNNGGRLPVERYLIATVEERGALRAGKTSIAEVARNRNLNAKYLARLWSTLASSHAPSSNKKNPVEKNPVENESSLLLDGLRSHWNAIEGKDAAALTAEVSRWQQALWRFTSVGHIGKVGGPKAWQEPVDPLQSRLDIRVKLQTLPGKSDIKLFLVTSDAGDGNEDDIAIWDRPRFVAAGQPELLLRDVRDLSARLLARRTLILQSAARCLEAADEVSHSAEPVDLAGVAKRFSVEPDVLAAWLEVVGVGTGSVTGIDSHLTQRIPSSGGYDFIKSWGVPETPIVSANSSDQHVRVPGNMKPHSIAVHPSPALNVVVGWKSPVEAAVRIEAFVQHAHPECGNGVTWTLERRRGNTRQRLASGVAQGAQEHRIGPFEDTGVLPGDVVSMIVGPRDGNHSCDLTAVDLTIRGGDRVWNLAADVSPDILAGNPHSDRFENADTWHFYTEPVSGSASAGPVIPADSRLAKWQSATTPGDKRHWADAVQKLVDQEVVEPADSPDGQLHRQLTSLGGPLFAYWRSHRNTDATGSNEGIETKQEVGLDPALFGAHPAGKAIDPASLAVQAPHSFAITIPADLVAGFEFVVGAGLDEGAGTEGSVQMRVVTNPEELELGVAAPKASETSANGPWTSNNRGIAYSAPIIVRENSRARQRFERSFGKFRELFPLALCYTKIVPVDEVVTLTLFYREDDQLRTLMLDEEQTRQLDQLWDDLHFVSQDALRSVDAYQQLMEFATQDADPKVFEPLRKPFLDRAAAHRERVTAAEPKHLDSLVEFAGRAFRRPLTADELSEIKTLYASLRKQEFGHEEALRLTLARVLVSPAFLYRIERPGEGEKPTRISDYELASRLSYFLWSSQPDDELLNLAAENKLHEPQVLLDQTHRLLRDSKSRRLATEFACQWLHVYEFDRLDEKSERHFPTFRQLRESMYEETIRFFSDLFQRDGTVHEILDADYTFLNESLANHYGIPNVKGGEWRRVAGVREFSRGGILAQASTLAKQSGASRTSPILRGNWISEVLLGEKLPKPPKGVPPLPDDEAALAGLTVRQLIERHSSEPKCIVCHQRIDPLGFSLEAFDAIGARREKDLGDRTIDSATKLMDGTQLEGLDGLREYIGGTRRETFARQFSKKILGYALGRAVQLSDEPLLDQIRSELQKNDDRLWSLVDAIVLSPQFQHVRGRDMTTVE